MGKRTTTTVNKRFARREENKTKSKVAARKKEAQMNFIVSMTVLSDRVKLKRNNCYKRQARSR